MMTRFRMTAGACLLLVGSGLVACSPGSNTAANTTVNAALAKALADAQKADTFYGVAKGIAEVAELTPLLSTAERSTIDKAIADLDPIDAKLEAAIADSSGDAVAIESLVSTLNDQALTLTNTAAPAIKAVPIVGGGA